LGMYLVTMTTTAPSNSGGAEDQKLGGVASGDTNEEAGDQAKTF